MTILARQMRARARANLTERKKDICGGGECQFTLEEHDEKEERFRIKFRDFEEGEGLIYQTLKCCKTMKKRWKE